MKKENTSKLLLEGIRNITKVEWAFIIYMILIIACAVAHFRLTT